MFARGQHICRGHPGIGLSCCARRSRGIAPENAGESVAAHRSAGRGRGRHTPVCPHEREKVSDAWATLLPGRATLFLGRATLFPGRAARFGKAQAPSISPPDRQMGTVKPRQTTGTLRCGDGALRRRLRCAPFGGGQGRARPAIPDHETVRLRLAAGRRDARHGVGGPIRRRACRYPQACRSPQQGTRSHPDGSARHRLRASATHQLPRLSAAPSRAIAGPPPHPGQHIFRYGRRGSFGSSPRYSALW
jgi:hypothetical protein